MTTDGLVVLASEVGVIEFPPEQIQQKGRLQPGRMFLVDTEEGRIVVDNEIKGKISRQKPYRRWLEENRIELRGLVSALEADADRSEDAGPAAALLRLHARGIADGRRRRWRPTARSRSARWAPTRRWPCSPNRPKLLFNYFKQLFAQVTNPPIDPLREGLVMSLMSFTGKQRNLLDETPEHCRQLKLSHPILTNEDMERLRTARRDDFKVVTLPAVFSATDADPGQALGQGARRTGRRGRSGRLPTGPRC